MFQDIVRQLFGQTFATALSFVLYFYPIWLPLILGFIFWDMWVIYVRNSFFLKTKYVLLEIKLPIEQTKSPVAMEVIISSLWELAGETTIFDRWWEGKTRPWYSLELASVGGEVKFFLWCRANNKEYIQARIYSQYPTVEVYEVPDYIKYAKYDPKVNNIYATHIELSKPSPIPIKTYVDYGLDKDPKEEFKVDPITPILEFLGTLRPGEIAAFQIVIRTHKKEHLQKGAGFSIEWDSKYLLGFNITFGGSKKTSWQDEAKQLVKEIVEKAKIVKNAESVPTFLNLSPGQTEMVKAIERNVNKPAFDTGIRGIYIAPKDLYNKANGTQLTGAFRQFNYYDLNGFKPVDYTSFSYPWADFRDRRMNMLKNELLYCFKHRAFFYAPHTGPTFVMSSEELATLYHFPGAVAATPTLTRIPSKKAQAPANLPI